MPKYKRYKTRAGQRISERNLPASVFKPRFKMEVKEAIETTEKPQYKDGVIQWKGLDITIEEARAFSKALSRTPVSRGRFPTEADLMISATFGEQEKDFDLSKADKMVIEKMGRWRDNYLKALYNITGFVEDEEIQNVYDELYWKISEMPLENFVKAMYEHDAELAVVFEASPPNGRNTDAFKEEWADRVSGIWARYIGQ